MARRAPGLPDERLLSDFLEGDESAFTELVRRHEDRIFALAFRMIGDRTDALDATQDTFIQAFRKAKAFRGDAAFGTWLYRIGINACHDLLRKRGRLPVPEEEPIEAAGPPATPLDDVVGIRMDVRRALAELTPEYREAVVLHDIGGVPYEEIAHITGVQIGTVKSRISRGRKRLAQLLEQHGRAPTSKDTR